jgi:hypothetical protein
VSAECFVFIPYWINYLIEIAVGIVGFVWNHLEHPGAILKHQGKA